MSLNHRIEATPGMRGGRPRIVGTRITVADVATMYLRLGLSVEEIAGKYDLSLASVHAAMAYYFEHREEIDQRIEEERAYAEAMRAKTPSLLQDKLRAMKRD